VKNYDLLRETKIVPPEENSESERSSEESKNTSNTWQPRE
jgi:hypothetical protein